MAFEEKSCQEFSQVKGHSLDSLKTYSASTASSIYFKKVSYQCKIDKLLIQYEVEYKKNLIIVFHEEFIDDIKRFSGAVVSTSDYEFAGPSSIPDEGRRRKAHPAVHPSKWIGR